MLQAVVLTKPLKVIFQTLPAKPLGKVLIGFSGAG
jgi:hypothetical protein